MKTGTGIFVFLVFGGIFFSACGNSGGGQGENDQLPTQAVETAFFAKYPSASDVNWEAKGVFQQSDFNIGQMEYEAWFNRSGIWLQAEYSTTYMNLPSKVKDLIANNINYPPTSWTPQEKVEVLDRKNYLLWYEIELKNGVQEVKIWSDADGYASRIVIEDLDGNDIPSTISSFIAIKYRNGLITEVIKLVNNFYEANLLDGENVKIVHFNASMNWLYTDWSVMLADLPQVVKAALDAPAYQDFTVKSASYQQYPDGDHYHFVLSQRDMAGPDISVNVDLNGNVIPD